MAIDNRGTFYQPTPPPQSGGAEELRTWTLAQFQLIAIALRSGRSMFESLDVLQEAPAKPFAGMVCYFAGGIVGPTEGNYEYRSNNTWNKL